MSTTKINYNSVITMYEKAGNQEKAEEFIVLGLDSFSDDSDRNDYDFLKNRTLDASIINRYKSNLEILWLFVEKGIEPQDMVWNLIAKRDSFKEIKEVVLHGALPMRYLEMALIRKQNIDCYQEIFRLGKITGLNYDFLLFNFMKIKARPNSKNYLACTQAILKYIPYNEECHLALARNLLNIHEKVGVEIANNIVSYFLNNCEDLDAFFQTRPDILLLFKKFNYTIPQEYYFLLIQQLKNLSKINIAWCIELYQVSDNDKVAILNHWAQNNQVVAFDTYFKYMTSPNPDYEGVGKQLDEEFKNKIAEVPEAPVKRIKTIALLSDSKEEKIK